jgi:hypothetical protein
MERLKGALLVWLPCVLERLSLSLICSHCSGLPGLLHSEPIVRAGRHERVSFTFLLTKQAFEHPRTRTTSIAYRQSSLLDPSTTILLSFYLVLFFDKSNLPELLETRLCLSIRFLCPGSPEAVRIVFE